MAPNWRPPPYNIPNKLGEVRRQQSEGGTKEVMLFEEGADVERTPRMLIATVVAIAVFIVVWWLATL